MYALVLFLHLLVQFQISVPADDVLRIVAVDVLVPVVEQERNAFYGSFEKKTFSKKTFENIWWLR